jgi:hypothetical protein
MKENNTKLIAFSLTILALVMIYEGFMLLRVNYYTFYNGNIQKFDQVIEKCENFDYLTYCKNPFELSHTVLSQYLGDSFYLDRNFINFLKLKINKDQMKLHISPLFERNFIYVFKATIENMIILFYEGTTIKKAEFEDHSEVFNSDQWYSPDFFDWPYFPDNGFLNSSLTGGTSPTLLRDVILIKMILDYNYCDGYIGALTFKMQQYICLNSALQVIFVYTIYTDFFID